MIEHYLPQPDESQPRYQTTELGGNRVLYRDLDIGDKEAMELRVPPEMLEKRELANIPAGYGIIGGAARSIAFELLTGVELPVRDVDLAGFPGMQSDLSPDTRHSVNQQYSPDDYAFGHGLKCYGSLEEYFESPKDTTLNDLLVINGTLVCSNQAFFDIVGVEFEHDENGMPIHEEDGTYRAVTLAGPIIRPTNIENTERAASRMMVFQAMLEEYLPDGQVPRLIDDDIYDAQGDTFLWAVAFVKAQEYGEGVALRFAALYQQLTGAPIEIIRDNPTTTIANLEYHMAGFLREGMEFFEDTQPEEDEPVDDEAMTTVEAETNDYPPETVAEMLEREADKRRRVGLGAGGLALTYD
jgi:hypothetical protein